MNRNASGLRPRPEPEVDKANFLAELRAAMEADAADERRFEKIARETSATPVPDAVGDCADLAR